MLRSNTFIRCVLIIVLAVAAACSQSKVAEAPAAPTMPAHWQITSDQTFSVADIKPVSEQLGADVSALRNTLYDVGGGKTVKLNTIVAATANDADVILASLQKMKPEEFSLRRELIIYEFVGKDAAIPEMREGRALLLAME